LRAILLAAGRGLRLQQPAEAELPKCLLEFGGRTLLQRHLQLLQRCGVREVVLVVGFRHEAIAAQLAQWPESPLVRTVRNERFTLGSVVSLHTAAAALTAGGDVLVMDADVLHHERILQALVADAPPRSRLLIDRRFEPGDEPVKVCVRDGVPIELRKRLAPDLAYDTIGESVGFFRFSEPAGKRLASIVGDYVDSGRADQPHEEAVRDLLRERNQSFEVSDVTGTPWIEIDFPADIERARQHILPRL
jgi:choline kinase